MAISFIATIGYEADTLAGVVDRLRHQAVDIVIDIRAVASSRRAGFSKTILAASLKAEGIDYVHLRSLGTPKPGRIAARAGRHGEMRKIYRAHLSEPDAVLALEEAMGIAGRRKAALLCFERDAGHCHRAIVADLIAKRLGCEIVDL